MQRYTDFLKNKINLSFFNIFLLKVVDFLLFSVDLRKDFIGFHQTQKKVSLKKQGNFFVMLRVVL